MLVITKLMAVFLVATGALLLLSSLRHRNFLCNPMQSQARRWNALFSLTIFFFLGYMAFLWELYRSPQVDLYQLLIAGIFLGGGLFVALVVRMSRKTISEVTNIAERDRHKALHDALTDLPNRSLLYARIEQAILLARRKLGHAAVILLDLDRFKDINDTLGHAIGDTLLVQLATRIRQCVRDTDTVARLGGDEFAIVLPLANDSDAVRVAMNIAQTIDQPVQVGEHLLCVGASMGIVVYPRHGADHQALLQKADIAMYQAKRDARVYHVYDEQLDRYSSHRLELAAALRDAVRSRDFYLLYQPKMDVASGEVISVEALLRWNNPKYQHVSPEEFIPVIEHIGLMNDLSLWIIQQALLQVVQWRKQGLNLKVAVNISARNLCDHQLAESLDAIFKHSNVKPQSLILEITESSMMINPNQALKLLSEMADMGIGLSIDDFGTGYSSLAYLKHLPASEVKLDKCFVNDILKDENDAVIVRTTIALAHNLGYRVVAEGVESQEILDWVTLWDCDCVQGYYISEPLSGAQAYNVLTTDKLRNKASLQR